MKKISIECTVQIWKEGIQFVAHAMPLDVVSSGKTLRKPERLSLKRSISFWKRRLRWEHLRKSLKKPDMNDPTKFGPVPFG